jgi:tetratricopeptide (TPR) repeat protein
MAIWGWVLAGIIIALNNNQNEEIATVKKIIKFQKEKQIVLSAGLLIPVIFVTFNLAKSEVQIYKLTGGFNPNVAASADGFKKYARSALETPFLDPVYKVRIAGFLIDYGDREVGLRAINEVILQDPRNLTALSVMAAYFENLREFEQALKFRQQIEKLDPWNAQNYYTMILDYQNLNNLTKSKEYAQKIKSFAAGTDIYIQLLQNFPNL